MERIHLSTVFIDTLKVYASKSKIVEQLYNDMDMNKFKELLGLVKKGSVEEEGSKNSQLTKEDLSVIVETLFKEMSVGTNAEIKCIIHNFIKSTVVRDKQFLQKVDRYYIDI